VPATGQCSRKMVESRDETRALLAFAAAVFVFHQLPAFVGEPAGDWVDLLTPFAVIGTAAFVIGRGASTLVLVIAIIGAVLYVDGHGIHLAANAIGHEELTGEAADVTHFWDEEWGHFEWHLGWFLLIGAFCLARTERPWLPAVCAALLGWTLFVSTVEGGSWWLELAATAVFVPWAVVSRRPFVVTVAASFGLAALLIGIWAVWQGGMPQFSDAGFL
jgi:hypothetical protein